MKTVIAALALTLPLFATSAFAQTAQEKPKSEAQQAQQEKMKTCNADAKGKTGDERKKFMSECLSAKPQASQAQKAQQDKMKSCNADAKGKTGDERKKFMSECLKKG